MFTSVRYSFIWHVNVHPNMEVHYFCPPFFFLAAILLEAAKKCLQVKTKEADVPPRAITVFRIEIKL